MADENEKKKKGKKAPTKKAPPKKGAAKQESKKSESAAKPRATKKLTPMDMLRQEKDRLDAAIARVQQQIALGSRLAKIYRTLLSYFLIGVHWILVRSAIARSCARVCVKALNLRFIRYTVYALGILGAAYLFYSAFTTLGDWTRHAQQRAVHALLGKQPDVKNDADDGQRTNLLAANTRYQHYVGIVVVNGGMDPKVCEQMIFDLPQEVSLAFNPHAPDLEKWVHASRLQGHDTLLTVPFEPPNYPRNDPGPQTLLTGRPPAENLHKLKTMLNKGRGILGVVNVDGFRFSLSPTDLQPVMEYLGKQDLLYLDTDLTGGDVYATLTSKFKVRTTFCDQYVDHIQHPQQLTNTLNKLEKLAKTRGQSLLIIDANPKNLLYVRAWLNNLKRAGITLSRVSTLSSVLPDINFFAKLVHQRNTAKPDPHTNKPFRAAELKPKQD